MPRAIPALVAFVALGLLSPSGARAAWELQVQLEREGRRQEGRLELDARYGMRWEQKGGRRGLILRSDRELTYVIQHAERSYLEQPWAEVRRFQERAAEMGKEGGLLERLEKMLKEIPPEERPRLERRLERLRRALTPAEETKEKVRVRATGRKKTLYGFAVEELLMEEGDRTHTFWVSREERLSPLAEALAQMAGKIAQGLRGPLGLSALFQAQRALLGEVRGVPIRSEVRVRVLGEESTHIQEVTSVSERSFPPSHFEPPPGYQKAEAPLAPPARRSPPAPPGERPR